MSVAERRWVVTGGARNLADVLDAIGATARAALAEGRVFVDGRRASDPRAVVGEGSVVEVYPSRASDIGVAIIDERGPWIAACKPALLATEPDRTGSQQTLLGEVARLLGRSPHELHAVSRLDVGVSGVVLLAKSIAERPLAPPGEHVRRYLAIVARCPDSDSGVWKSPIERRGRGLQSAETHYTVLARAAHPPRSLGTTPALLSLLPVTGRMHQLRIHAARAGSPIIGDREHGKAVRFTHDDGSVVELGRIALHAASLSITLAQGPWECRAPVPEELVELWRSLGGSSADFPL